MFPEPVAIPIRDPLSRDTISEYPAVDSLNNFQTALRIQAALRAAQQDAAEDRLPDDQWDEWTRTVKVLSSPQLVVASTEDLNSEDLLANDSLGG